MTSPRVSVAAERGLVYWPAIRPIFTIGTCAAYVSTTAIDNKVRSLPWMLAAVTPSKVSAQSPPCRMNDSPAATLAILLRRLSHSPANTSGGSDRSRATTSSTSTASSYVGCCSGLSAWRSSRVGMGGLSGTRQL